MSLISERIGYLFRRYTGVEIAEITGIEASRLSTPLGDIEPVEKNLRRNIYNLYHRTVYGDLRAVGASAVEARRYRSTAITKVLTRLGDRTELIDDLAKMRFETYKAYQMKNGSYTNDEDTLATLKQSIARAMGKSKLPPSKYDYDSYPTLEHGVIEDDF